MNVRSLCLSLVVAMATASVWTACRDKTTARASAGPAKYHCPMHPSYVSDRPGDCPICNMKLVRIPDAGSPAAPMRAATNAVARARPGQFHCTMCPNVVSNAPGRCPECGMKLVPVADAAAEDTGATVAPAALSRGSFAGRTTVSLSPEKRQLIGLRTALVEQRHLTREVKATAVVQHDETRLSRIAPRFSGWVRALHVSYSGQQVQAGEPLYTVYSPELLVAENEYLLARRHAAQSGAAADAEQVQAARRVLEAARRRLELLEIGPDEIRALEERGTASDELVFRAPVSGHVVTKTAVQGKAFMNGEALYEIGDLSHLWLRASVLESDMPQIRIGQAAAVRFPNLANRSFAAKVTFLYPHTDPLTRRGEIRLELENPDLVVRPDMWASVEIQQDLGDRLVVPDSAVLDTGKRQIGFVDQGDGHLEPREVRTGLRTGDAMEVLGGLKPGERVVTRALFLVDSESQLKAVIAGMGAAGGHEHSDGESHEP